MASMDRRAGIRVIAGLVVLVAVAAIGAVAYKRSGALVYTRFNKTNIAAWYRPCATSASVFARPLESPDTRRR